MDQVVMNTKKGKFALLDVKRIQTEKNFMTAEENLFIFYDDKKVKIPLQEIFKCYVVESDFCYLFHFTASFRFSCSSAQ